MEPRAQFPSGFGAAPATFGMSACCMKILPNLWRRAASNLSRSRRASANENVPSLPVAVGADGVGFLAGVEAVVHPPELGGSVAGPAHVRRDEAIASRRSRRDLGGAPRALVEFRSGGAALDIGPDLLGIGARAIVLAGHLLNSFVRKSESRGERLRMIWNGPEQPRWCPWPESNQHSLRNSILSRARLPVPPQGHSHHPVAGRGEAGGL
jgi:hypothetical protein